MRIDGNGSTHEISEKLQEASIEFGNIVAALAMTRNSGTDASHLFLSSMVGPLVGLVGTVRPKGDDKYDRPENLKKQVLFATLVLYHSIEFTNSELGGSLNTGFDVFNDAVNDYERFTGENADLAVNSHLLKALREWSKEGEKPLADFLANSGNNNKLN